MVYPRLSINKDLVRSSYILDDKSDVIISREIHSELYMSHSCGLNNIDWPTTLRTCRIRLRCGNACIAGRPLRGYGYWVIRTVLQLHDE